MAFAKDASLVRTNGRTVVKIDSGSGLVDVGFVATVMATAKPQVEPTTLGDLPVGYDLELKWDGKQTDAATYAAYLAATFPNQIQAQGNNDFATLNSPTLVPDLEKKMDGTTGSKISVTAQFKGATKAQAMGFITNAS